MSVYDKLCRICLKDGASYPIFETNENFAHNIQSKISTCLHVTVEDVDGYPRQICNNCNETLDVICSFINTFTESCKTLESKLLNIKTETNNNYDSDFDRSINIKVEYPEDLNANKTSYSTIQSKTRNIQSKRKIVVKKVLCRKPQKTHTVEEKRNTVASSILEGEFTWSGEEWCLSKNNAATDNQIKRNAVLQTKNKINRVKKNKNMKGKKAKGPKLCDLCGEMFDHDHKLVAHKKRIHFDSLVKCPVCARTCSSEYYLNIHIERRHRDNKHFECKTCGSRFAFIKDLHRHTKYVHEKKGIKKQLFTCDLCDKSYKCTQSLVIHKRSVHTGERPEVCTICSASFFHISYLREHMRLHTGETPYKCPICDRGYAQRGNMKSHLRNHRRSELDAATLSKIKPRLLRFLKP